MAVFDTLIENLITELKNEASLTDIDFKAFYGTAPKLNPLTKTTVVFGFGGVKINNCAMNDYMGITSSAQVYLKESDYTVEFLIYTPQNSGGSSGIETLDKLCDILLFKNNTTEKSVSISANKQTYDSKNFAFVINGFIKFKFAVSKENNETAISNIVVKGVY